MFSGRLKYIIKKDLVYKTKKQIKNSRETVPLNVSACKSSSIPSLQLKNVFILCWESGVPA
jgi:hypothetical protein